VTSGVPVELDAHLARLDASVRNLFGHPSPPGLRELALERSLGRRLGRLRLTVAPASGDRLSADVATTDVEPALVFPSDAGAVALRSVVVEGGLGEHKWQDRRLFERLATGSGEIPLLVDGDGTVLEAARANVFLVRDEVLWTPPADGRILAGIARRGVIEIARAAGIELREERVTIGDLLAGDEVFLTGSVRGVEPVRSVDRTGPRSAGDVTRRVALGLRQRWLASLSSGSGPESLRPGE
jgi:para-aminobenzoate synthetase / 4-amino-4-deoxychorismate lyase